MMVHMHMHAGVVGNAVWCDLCLVRDSNDIIRYDIRRGLLLYCLELGCYLFICKSLYGKDRSVPFHSFGHCTRM